ncbi:MAG: EI24 domain-containing protein [Desulforhopalus sp.]
MQKQLHRTPKSNAEWIPLSRSLLLMFSRKTLFGWSFMLFLLTIFLTWIGYQLAVDFIDNLSGNLLPAAPAADGVLGWLKHAGWVAMHWLFLFISRTVAFYLAFLLAYTLSTPGYVFLATAAEKLHAGKNFDPDLNFTVTGFLIDILEGIKIAAFGVFVTVVALFVNFIPGIGQAAVFVLYSYYSALMFLDYPTSRRRWSLGRKLRWLRNHSSPAFRLGVLPALLSMIPLLNIFAIALFFPLLTIHSTLNFSAIELNKSRSEY